MPIRELARTLRTWYYAKPLPPLGDAERTALSELQATFQRLQALPTEGLDPSLAAWHRNLNEIRYHVLHGNPRKFLRWGIIHNLMFVSFAPYVATELDYLRRLSDWEYWRPLLSEPAFGGPPRYPLYPNSTGNTIHQISHLAHFQTITTEHYCPVNERSVFFKSLID
jgi:hypothetical protein